MGLWLGGARNKPLSYMSQTAMTLTRWPTSSWPTHQVRLCRIALVVGGILKEAWQMQAQVHLFECRKLISSTCIGEQVCQQDLVWLTALEGREVGTYC